VSSATIDPKTPPMVLLDRFGPERAAAERAPSVEEALEYVRGLATTHYENFSVLTSLVPPELRDSFAAVYAFCRWSDDLGDETGATPEARERSLQLLGWWRRELHACFEGGEGTAHPVYVALRETALKRGVPRQPFDDLISAFELDQTKQYYGTWEEVVEYCRLSANPVGRIVLALAGVPDDAANAERYAMSDATCTALQLTNHWQDVRRDLLERDRVYLPSADTGITPAMLREWVDQGEDPAARVPYIKAMRGLVERTRPLFVQGRELPRTLPGGMRGVVWLFGAGGEAVLRSIERMGCATLWKRPTLGGFQKGRLLARAWMMVRVAGKR
jgi:squalene synthase HpnC